MRSGLLSMLYILTMSIPGEAKLKGTLHWVSAEKALDAEVRLYDHLFTRENPDEVEDGQDFTSHLNPDSLTVRTGCKVEPFLGDTQALDRYQFERIGYFCTDTDSRPDKLVFNRTVGLRDTWAKMQGKQ